MEMSKEQFESMVNAFLAAKRAEVCSNNDFSVFVERASVQLNQLGIWEESKHLLKNYILMYFRFIEDAEFCNGEVRRKKNIKE